MIDRQLVHGDFADKVGRTFVISFGDRPSVPVTLIEAELLKEWPAPGMVRPPFSLIFRSGDAQVLPQQLYLVEQEDLGEMTLCLVPVGKDERGVRYEALFN